MSLQTKIDYSLNLLRNAEPLALSMHPDGFHLAFSGGKDSIVLYRLAQMAGVKFHAHMQLTTIDPPEVMRFVREKYSDVELHRPAINFYNLIRKKKMLPVRNVRYCCQYLKEQAGAGTVTLIGIRAAESSRRANRNEVEVNNHKFSGSLDQFNVAKEQQHICLNGKDKLLISPVFQWTNNDIWTFIRENNMDYCRLYDEGYQRIGCVFCPMASAGVKQLYSRRYPLVAREIKRSIQYLIDNNHYMNKYNATADEVFDWWISNKSANEYFAMLRKQTKINFYE
jgi:phosphoadenosine phosphosulfate reductase